MIRIRKAVFPVAGFGTRFLPATKAMPKEMLPIVDKPLIQYAVEEAIAAGIDTLIFVTARNKRAIEDHFDADPELEARLSGKDQIVDDVDYTARGVEFYYARQRRPDGNADAVRLAQEFVGNESFVVAFGDTIIYSPDTPRVIERMVDSHERHQSVATIGVWEVPREDTKKYGVVRPAGEIGDEFAVRDIVEKPDPAEAPSCLAVAARYIFTPDIFPAIDALEPGLGGELWLTDAIRILLRRGAPVRCVRLNGVEKRYDIGMPLTYYKAFTDFALRDPEHGDEFRVYLQDKLNGK